MHSLKPTGDNIAQEFYNLIAKNEKLAKLASGSDDSVEDEKVLSSLDAAHEKAQNFDPSEFAAKMKIASEGGEEFDVESMFSGEGDTGFDLIDVAAHAAASEIDHAIDSISASEKRVLSGLEKIASSLKAKGEAFAADVVLATSKSIEEDIVKEASLRSAVKSGLKKIASELYKENDPLAGDMVAVTINKLTQ